MSQSHHHSVAITFASRAENLLMADLVSRSLAADSSNLLFADLPLNSERRCSAIRGLINQMNWHQVRLSWYVKFSLLPAPLRRLSGFGLERALRLMAVAMAVCLVWAEVRVRRRRTVSLICGRPGIAMLLCCRLLSSGRIVFLDSGPKQDVISHLQSSWRLLRRIPTGLGGFWGTSSVVDALSTLTDQPISLLCWSTSRYTEIGPKWSQLQPITLSEFVQRFPAPAPLGDSKGAACVFLIGKADGTPAEIRMLVELCQANFPQAMAIYFSHPRELYAQALEVLAEHGISMADPGLSIEGHAMIRLRSIHLLHVFAIRQSQSIQTLRVLYGTGFGVTYLR